MDADKIFQFCAAERRRIADLAETLDDEQLGAPSLCTPWDVRTVIAHLTVVLTVTPVAMGRAMLHSRGNLHRANDELTREAAAMPIAQLVAVLRDKAESRTTPPIGGPRAPLTDLIVHGADIEVPLGLRRDPPVAPLETALDFVSGSPAGLVPRGRLDGIRLVPIDLDRRWGSGAELDGRADDLLLVVCGRTGVLDRVDGPGAAILAARL